MLVLKTDRATTDTSLPILRRDTLLEGDNGGVLWLFDLKSLYSFPTQGVPANGAAVINLDETGNNGTVVRQSGDPLAYSGNGLDFTGVTKVGNYVNGPANPLASIWAATNQYWIMCAYLKLPTQANWNTDGALHNMFQTAPIGTSYTTQPELAMIAQQSPANLSFRRQTAAGTVTSIALTVPTADMGQLAQVAFWRDASGIFGRVKSAANSTLTSGAVGANNTQNFAANTPKIGPSALNQGVGAVMNAAQQNAAKWRVYRAFIENLEISGRSATSVLDADWTRTVARGVFS